MALSICVALSSPIKSTILKWVALFLQLRAPHDVRLLDSWNYTLNVRTRLQKDRQHYKNTRAFPQMPVMPVLTGEPVFRRANPSLDGPLWNTGSVGCR